MTRAGIILKDSNNLPIYLYSHTDGFPSVTLYEILKMCYYEGDDEKLREKIINSFREVNKVPGDADFVYVIDFDDRMIYTYDNRWDIEHTSGLLRVDEFTNHKYIEDIDRAKVKFR